MNDINGDEIEYGDRVNVYFTSGDGEHIHDCIYEARRGCLGDMQFQFVGLMWENHGHNQHPVETLLCLEYGTISVRTIGRVLRLIVPDTYRGTALFGKRWKLLDESEYFEQITD